MSERRSRGLIVRRGKGVIGTFPLPPGTKDATLPRPSVPADVVPLDQTPLPSGLAVDRSIESYAYKRWSPTRWNPFRSRWPEVHAFDERVAQLERRQADVNAELATLQEGLRTAIKDDGEALARWVADPVDTRPVPAAPQIEERIAELERERDALTLAMHHELDRKAAYVSKHRGRLRLEAEKAHNEAVAQLQAAIDKAEQARDEVVRCVEAEFWAANFPGEDADAGRLQLALMKGGRVTRAIPNLQSQTVATQLIAALREDAAWLDTVTADEERKRDELDPYREAVWEMSDEGQQAMARKAKQNRERIEATKYRNTAAAGWED
jgi:hypothetical protein